jgi:formate-dependent phosphoribosylglycinamide formyltransferase (GAR transformylase)
MTTNVVFVAPFFGNNMTHCLHALQRLDDVKVGVVTSVSREHVPALPGLAGHYQVENALDAQQLTDATRAYAKEWGRVDRLIGFLEPLQEPLAAAREKLGVDGVHAEVAKNFRDKNKMKEVLAKAGLPVARQARVTGVDDALALAREVGYPLVVKPIDGVGSKDTMRVADQGELFQALERLSPSRARPIQAEQFVVGDEHTLEAVVIGGEVVWQSSTYYLPGPLTVLENPWMQYCVLLPREQDEPHVRRFKDVNKAALKALGLRDGISHMEWFDRGPSQPPIIGEVGARPAGVNIMDMNGFAHGVDMWAKWCELEVRRTFSMPERKYACGSAFLRGQGRGGTVVEVSGLAEVLKELGDDVVVKGKLPKVGQPRTKHYEGEGNIVVRHPTTQGAVEALKQIVQRTKITYG